MLKRSLRRGRAELRLLAGRAGRLRRALDGTRAAVLMYHRVLPRSDATRLGVEPGMFVTPETFDRHLAWLRSDLHPMALGEIASRLATGEALPPGACAITFDDGWRDNHDHALPALERHRVPATLFLVTGRVGTPGAFWPDAVFRAVTRLPGARQRELAERFAGGASAGRAAPATRILDTLKALSEDQRPEVVEALLAAAGRGPADAEEREILDWDEVDRLARAGVAIEAHGTSHAILTGLAPERAAAELRSCREQLREHGYGQQALLAYPSGACTPHTCQLAREAGYVAAVTTEPGLVHAGLDALAWPRVALHQDVSSSRAEFIERFALG